MCGEKSVTWLKPKESSGSPPRVRGKVNVGNNPLAKEGITPACAGKSDQRAFHRSEHQDHPRVCGEKVPIWVSIGTLKGSPPRVRGKDILRL